MKLYMNIMSNSNFAHFNMQNWSKACEICYGKKFYKYVIYETRIKEFSYVKNYKHCEDRKHWGNINLFDAISIIGY